MKSDRPQLPTSGEVLGFILGAFRLRTLLSQRMPDRTVRRVLADEPGVKAENRREVLAAAVLELFPDELLVAWGAVPPEAPGEPAGVVRAGLVGMAEGWLAGWDHAAGALRSTDIGIPDVHFAVLPWVRLVAVELGVRVGAYLPFSGVTTLTEEDTHALVHGRAFDRLVQRYRQATGGIPREELARGGGVSESTVDEWLSGRALPQSESLLSLAAVIASRVPATTEAEVTFHLRWAVAASDAVRRLWDVCPNHPPVEAGMGPPRPAQFVIEFLAVLEIAHTLLLKPPGRRKDRRSLWWMALLFGSCSPPGKVILAAALEQARDSYLRADLLGVLHERWQERVLMLYRQLPTVEGARKDPLAKKLGLSEEILPMIVEMEAWGMVSPNPGGWHHAAPQSDLGFAPDHESRTVILDKNDMMTPAQRASRRALEAQHAKGDEHEALAQHQRLVAMEPKNERAHFWLGCSLAAVGRIDEALVECRIAAGLKPDWSLPAIEVAIIQSNAGRSAEALASMRAIDGKYEVDTHFANVYGYTLMYEKEYAAAIPWFRKAIEHNAEHARATMHLAHCLLMLGERVEGRRLAKQARHWGERSVYEALKAGRYDGRGAEKGGAR